MKHLYKVVFFNQGEVYEIYAKQVSQEALYGFVEISDLVFGSHTSVVVDPSEERLKSEFEGVKRVHIPMHSVIRIDEVEKQGTAKIFDASDKKVTPFPIPNYTPSKPGKN